jgi:hypothetical protein
MSTWPPPPDLASIRELVRDADVEGFISDGAPADEYDHEAELILAAIAHLTTAQLTEPTLMPLLEAVWSKSFGEDDDELALRRPALEALTQQITRFFGPEATPQVREQNQ